jgi:copper transport protein
LFVGVGGAFFGRWIVVEPLGARFQRRLALLLAAGAVAVAMSIGLQGLDMLGADWPEFFKRSTWIAGAGGSSGAAAGLALAAFGLAGGSLAMRGVEVRNLLSIAAVVMVGVALATTGHASAASPQWLTRPAVFVHAIGVTIWVGALPPLLLQARAGTASLAKTLSRFSHVAIWTVPLLIVAGLFLAKIQVVEPGALLATTYGEILSAKLVAVALLLALAVVNRRFLTPRVAGGAPAGRRWMARSIAGEILLSVAILGLVAGWRFTPPPRALAGRAPAAPEMLHLHGAKMMATLTFSPGHVGENRVHIDLLTGDFGPLDPKEVSISLAPADKSIEPRAYSARPEGDGGYAADGVFVPVSGKWTIDVSALIDDFTKSELSGEREFAN